MTAFEMHFEVLFQSSGEGEIPSFEPAGEVFSTEVTKFILHKATLKLETLINHQSDLSTKTFQFYVVFELIQLLSKTVCTIIYKNGHSV